MIDHFKTWINITLEPAVGASLAWLCLRCLGAINALREMLSTT